MSLIKDRKRRVEDTDKIMREYILSLNLGSDVEDKLMNCIYDHIDTVRVDAYSDGVGDTVELLGKKARDFVELAAELEEFPD